ncbi:NAD-dependent epimerase/dehydratase family protein [Kitasatospora sp. MAP5-34]|uniref:NAD-dependent epimerase/dehydratase family protein n=1 Tax=Kitasatospora sp. MAP5-34 TaxID=3035102 RepID=UPI0024731754|nr:NAD-dependent epimerase/dehydratase family protein [Kitasatospora sp. MAP5-34]MDH6574649.1 nucleoside-diphosphate-sugar epimerase [Kitasatospora sp. MAP5-34]
MRAVVTGAAGFIGSHLCAYLLACGDEVVGVDAFTDYYEPAVKERNLAPMMSSGAFSLQRVDLLTADLGVLLAGADVVYHLAGQPGVRPSWGAEFRTYAALNVLATQAVLEAARGRRLRKLVYASSSSVYGDAASYPTAETLRPQPASPYGVTKLAAEHLCELYRSGFGVPTVSLRLFTVYGPRQRPEMAFARLVAAAASGGSFPLYGDGEQSRDFTYVTDVVTAMRDAACSDFTGVANIGGGCRTTMREVISVVEELVGPVEIVRLPAQRGDVRHTGADITVAAGAFGYRPRTRLAEGLAAMVAGHGSPSEVASVGQ